MTEDKENCNFQQNYNVFGLDDKPCCYLYHKYCKDVEDCYFKELQKLRIENKKLKEIKMGIFSHDEDADWSEVYFYKNKADKYKSALEEIKRILIVCQEFKTCERCEFYKKCNKDLEGCIMEIIKEVLNHSEG